MKKFYLLSHDNGQDAKVVLAQTKYEAIGFYLFEEVEQISSASLDRVNVLPPEQKIEVATDGLLVNKTIEEIWKEKDDWITPKTIATLDAENKLLEG